MSNFHIINAQTDSTLYTANTINIYSDYIIFDKSVNRKVFYRQLKQGEIVILNNDRYDITQDIINQQEREQERQRQRQFMNTPWQPGTQGEKSSPIGDNSINTKRSKIQDPNAMEDDPELGGGKKSRRRRRRSRKSRSKSRSKRSRK